MWAVILFILGGVTLGFSMLFFLAPRQLGGRKVGDLMVGQKPGQKGLDGILNKVVSIDEKVTFVGTSMGLFLIVITAVLLYLSYTLIKR